VKLAEHNGIHSVWVPGHMRIEGNETAHQLARLDSPHPPTGPQPTLHIPAKVAMGVITGWTSCKTPRLLAVLFWIKAS